MKALPLSLVTLAAALLVSACLNDPKEDSGAPDVLVRIVDSAGVAFGADTVYWSYQADGGGHAVVHKASVAWHGSDTTKKAATRMNAAGTEWAIAHEGLHGAVFIRASYHKAAGALCMDHGYEQLEINADTLPKEVTLTLEVATMCE